MSHKQWNSPPEFAIDAKKTYHAILETDVGEMKIKLFADKTPVTVNNFVFLETKAITTIRFSIE